MEAELYSSPESPPPEFPETRASSRPRASLPDIPETVSSSPGAGLPTLSGTHDVLTYLAIMDDASQTEEPPFLPCFSPAIAQEEEEGEAVRSVPTGEFSSLHHQIDDFATHAPSQGPKPHDSRDPLLPNNKADAWHSGAIPSQHPGSRQDHFPPPPRGMVERGAPGPRMESTIIWSTGPELEFDKTEFDPRRNPFAGSVSPGRPLATPPPPEPGRESMRSVSLNPFASSPSLSKAGADIGGSEEIDAAKQAIRREVDEAHRAFHPEVPPGAVPKGDADEVLEVPAFLRPASPADVMMSSIDAKLVLIHGELTALREEGQGKRGERDLHSVLREVEGKTRKEAIAELKARIASGKPRNEGTPGGGTPEVVRPLAPVGSPDSLAIQEFRQRHEIPPYLYTEADLGRDNPRQEVVEGAEGRRESVASGTSNFTLQERHYHHDDDRAAGGEAREGRIGKQANPNPNWIGKQGDTQSQYETPNGTDAEGNASDAPEPSPEQLHFYAGTSVEGPKPFTAPPPVVDDTEEDKQPHRQRKLREVYTGSQNKRAVALIEREGSGECYPMLALLTEGGGGRVAAHKERMWGVEGPLFV